MERLLRHGSVAAVLTAVAAVSVPTPAGAASGSYVALGDSYSAGTGTRAKVDDCYRSQYGYPKLVAASQGLSLDYQACSGATTSSLLSNQTSTLGAGTNYVTLTIGGNDVGFTSILTECAKPGWLSDCAKAVNGGRAILDGVLPGRYDNVFSTIRSKAPNAKVVVSGYPHIFNGEDCNALTFFSPEEQASLNTATTDLNNLAKSKAASRSFSFVDAVPSFKGHAVCDSPEWLNGLSNPIEESYHPNRDGNRGYANLFGPALTGRNVRIPAEKAPAARVSNVERVQAQVKATRSFDLTSPANLEKARAAGPDPAEITRLDADLRSGDTATAQQALTRLRALDAEVG